ncbi:urease subunit alpha [Nocardioides eburneiflavus]|uniref:Urease subunit alpha n=1 Tax=Nocardioides eburneiflavus TaxID=2518372 RepID=A0A4Z1CIG9_9ACTN|nr:urease subunit alpha [Nocardioides eburneiflavus]TGN65757.1 urease subunit alpha [Nocardioides eburneiflavus]
MSASRFSVGDRIVLGDTGLVIEVESDAENPGDEFSVGFAQTARDGLHLKAAAATQTCDVVVVNALVLDPLLGIVRTSIGIREGRISSIGRAGNPDTMDGVEVVVGTGTSIIDADGLLLTAGVIDTHVHLLTPRVMEEAISSGVTTVIGQEFGPVWGVGVNSPWALRTATAAFDAWPVNIGFLGRGSSSTPGALTEALVEGGACGFKVHEDLGAHPRALDTALTVADEYDVQVALHTDGLNESGSVADTLAVIGGRTVHAFHIEGCGGGHVPDVLQMAGVQNVIGSSTNPTLPYGRDAIAEHLPMILAVHGHSMDHAADEQRAAERVRAGTMAAEDVLHDLGVIPITSSDALGMGRAGETVRRTFALAGKMKGERGPEHERHDNERVLRYLAKLTVNPALAHGLGHDIGTVAVGKRADLVLWSASRFGTTPEMVLKSGFPAWGVTGDPNASITHAEPLVMGPLFGAHGAAAVELSVAYVSAAAVANGGDRTPTRRLRVAVNGVRSVDLTTMVRHGRLGEVHVDVTSAQVSLDGELLTSEPAERIALSRTYFL